MKEHFRNIFDGFGSVFNIYPGPASLPPELHRYLNPPRTVEEAFMADADAMRRDWERVGSSLRQVLSGTDRVGPRQ
ncbi:MAG: hypothetical protein H7836_09430 [Magnetococcus sp. YQC-3]